jgi:hypothetical protein
MAKLSWVIRVSVRGPDGVGVAVGAGVTVGGLRGVAVGEGVEQAETITSDSRVTVRVVLILISLLLLFSWSKG